MIFSRLTQSLQNVNTKEKRSRRGHRGRKTKKIRPAAGFPIKHRPAAEQARLFCLLCF